jgi:hypothetical protein
LDLSPQAARFAGFFLPLPFRQVNSIRIAVRAHATGLLVSGFAFWGLERLFIRQEEKQGLC